MARARNIKPGFFRNAELVELPFETRLLFIGLWTLADREGRLEDRPKQIKMELFPADQCDVGSMLDQLSSSGFISRYEVDSVRFIEVQNFIKHQDPHYKEKASEIPPPEGKENFIKATGVTRNQRQRILERDKYVCQSCGATDNLCIDHIMPVSCGGDSSDENLQALCGSCNTKKGNKIDGEDKNSRQRRVYVGSNLNQKNRPSPSDSLIPDSLIPDSLIPDSLIPESLLLNPEPKHTAKKTRRDEYSDEFLDAWNLYPSRPGANKAQSFKAWSARINEGINPILIVDGVIRYANYCKSVSVEPNFIKQPATFFGPDRHFETDWTPPAIQAPAKTQYQINQEATARAIFGTRKPANEPRVITGEVVA